LSGYSMKEFSVLITQSSTSDFCSILPINSLSF
jgi:hypothetical protein